MVQLLNPTSTVSNDAAWVASSGTIHGAIDEGFSPVDTTDYVANGTPGVVGEGFVVGLAAGTDPNVHTGHTLRISAFRGPQEATTLTARVLQGETEIAERSLTLINSYTTFEEALTEGEAATITDYGALRIECVRGAGTAAAIRVAAAQLELPDVVPPDPGEEGESALVVEDGTGLADADSYVSVADASEYMEKYKSSSDFAAWDDLEVADQDVALRQATQYIDTFGSGRWVGTRVLETQALDWPRAGATTVDDFAVDSDVVPESVRRAAAELALRVAKGDTILPDLDEPGTIASESVKLGPIEESISYLGGKGQLKQYTVVAGLLAGLLVPGGQAVRG